MTSFLPLLPFKALSDVLQLPGHVISWRGTYQSLTVHSYMYASKNDRRYGPPKYTYETLVLLPGLEKRDESQISNGQLLIAL